jgi:hypothetical protein
MIVYEQAGSEAAGDRSVMKKYEGKAMMKRCAPITVGREAGLEALWTMHFPSVQISIISFSSVLTRGWRI